ncbi:baseplate J/gp47 family protein [Cellvibrio mixtus]|uniref:baseplate J/gp47 family protein n=1 Tax=Cellvibrio mixtus TaxID=39650 RepID=UPI00058663B7|nr:baseplate J/gp47 family protein [Cellvibrio mixtus]
MTTLPPPKMLEQLDYEHILAERKTAFLNSLPVDQRDQVAAVLALESEPITKLLQESSYRELVLRNRINDAAVSNLISFAQDTDLDFLGQLFEAPRLPGELDERYRERLLLRIAAMAGMGTREYYLFHALSISLHVTAAEVIRTAPGYIDLVVRLADSQNQHDLLQQVKIYFLQDHIKILGPALNIRAAIAKPVNLTGTVYRLQSSPVNLAEQLQQSWPSLLAQHAKLGQSIAKTWAVKTLHIDGVARLELDMADVIAINSDEYAVAGNTQFTDGGVAW